MNFEFSVCTYIYVRILSIIDFLDQQRTSPEQVLIKHDLSRQSGLVISYSQITYSHLVTSIHFQNNCIHGRSSSRVELKGTKEVFIIVLQGHV